MRTKMRSATLKLGGVALAALLQISAPASAQDEETEATDTSREPRAAVMAPRASSALLLDIARAGDQLVVAGQRGNILRSTDGDTWKQVAVPVDATLTRLRFLDDKLGWATGYDGTVLHTADGGASWTLQHFDADWARPYFDVLFFDAQNGLLAGANGALLRSSDGGTNWTPVETDVLMDGPNLYNLVPLADGSLLLTGERGFLARSTDRGTTWQQMASPYTGSYFGALAVGNKGAIVFGLRGNAFHAVDLGSAAVLTAETLEAMRAAALDPEAATSTVSPISEVAGWKALATTDFESLFGGTVTADGRVLLFGMNGHVMHADLQGGRIERLPVKPDNNMNAGITDGNALIVVGTAGVQKHALTP